MRPPVGVMSMQRRGRYHALPNGRTMLLWCESLRPPMSQSGHSRRSRFGRESAWPPISDMSGGCQIRREVPIGDLSRCSKLSDLLYHLVGNREQRRRHGEAEHAGGLHVDDQLELARLHHRQARWLGALEDTADVDAGLTPRVLVVASVAHQPADLAILTICICRGDRVARRQIYQLDTPADEKAIAANEKCVRLLACKMRERRTYLAAGACLELLDLKSHGTRNSFCVSQDDLGNDRIGGIDEHGHTSHSRQ